MNSDWQLYIDLTDRISQSLDHIKNPDTIEPYHTLYAEWSKRLIPDPLATTPALLALTHKAGCISFWSYSKGYGFEYQTNIMVHHTFVNIVEWTNWKKLDDGTSVSYIISSDSHGRLSISSVKAKYYVNDDKQTILQDVLVKTEIEWFKDQPSFITLIKAYDDIEKEGRQIKIAISKGITVQMMCIAVKDNGELKAEDEWEIYDLENSALGLCGGSWINSEVFRCYTVEGEGLIFGLEDSDREKSEINLRLVRKFKQQWMEEQMKLNEDDLLLNGSDAFPYVWGAVDGPDHIFTAIYFGMRPTVDVHYRPESVEDASLGFILQKKRGIEVEGLCGDVDSYVNNPDLFFVKPFRGLLRELLQYVIDDNDLKPFENWISKLKSHLNDKKSRSNEGLTRSIFSEPSTVAARLLINTEIELQNYETKYLSKVVVEAFSLAKKVVQVNFLNNIFSYALSLSKEQLSNFGEQDVIVLLLLVDVAQSLEDEELIQSSLSLCLILQELFSNLSLHEEIQFATNYPATEPVSDDKKAREKCPVCDGFVHLLKNQPFGQCSMGHFWEICSVTKRVLYKPNTRKCSTCGVKSLQENNDDSLTDIILRNCSKCIFCGSGLLL